MNIATIVEKTRINLTRIFMFLRMFIKASKKEFKPFRKIPQKFRKTIQIDKAEGRAYSRSMINLADAVFSSPEFADFLFDNIAEAVFLVDRNLLVKKINKSFRSLFFATDEIAINQYCGNVLGCENAINQNKICGEATECATCTLREIIIKEPETTGEINTTLISRRFFINEKSVPKHFQLTSKQAIYNGEPIAIIVLHDITELMEQKTKIEEMVNKDFLTGLVNRRYFFDVGESLFQNAKRGNISISVAMFDIDHFKRVNDACGHAAGDFVLKEISGILIANLRKADIISRFGGEEFCILLHCKGTEDSYTVIDKLRLFVELHAFMFDGKKIDITISAGLTSVLGDSLDAMVEKADEMLYKAKNGGRNRTEEFSGDTK